MKNAENQYMATTRLIRLIYYNNTLLKNDIITKREHDRIYLLILSKYGKILSNQSDKFSHMDIFPAANKNNFFNIETE